MNADPAPNSLTPAALQAWLQATFDFDSADVQANRQGQLSPRQKGRLSSDAERCLAFALVLTLLFSVPCVAPVCFALAFLLAGSAFSIAAMLAGFGAIVVPLTLGPVALLGQLLLLLKGVPRLQESRQGQALCVSGEAQLVSETYHNGRMHFSRFFYYRVNGQQLFIPQRVTNIGAQYQMLRVRGAFYYTPRTKTLLSIEAA